MTEQEMKELRFGDVISLKGSLSGYIYMHVGLGSWHRIVTLSRQPGRMTERVAAISNWQLLSKRDTE
jgi:hypothetical protein